MAAPPIHAFEHYYRQLEAGETGLMPEDSIEPVSELPDARRPARRPRRRARGAAARRSSLRLNGGLGTSMGLTGAKSLLEAKDGLSFLDVIARQVLALRAEHDAELPLVLMDSFSTREDSLAALARYPRAGHRAAARLPPEQGAEAPRRRPEPVEWPDNPALEWCPPGHGDLYTALVTSGMLERRCSRAASSTRSSPTPTTSARCSSRASSPGCARTTSRS